MLLGLVVHPFRLFIEPKQYIEAKKKEKLPRTVDSLYLDFNYIE